jgi:hypothetical protein
LNIYWLCLVTIVAIAVPLSLFEVWGITHYKVGWAKLLPQDKAWAKPLIRKAPFNLVGLQLLSRYHFFTYCVVVPTAVATLGICLQHHATHFVLNWIGWTIFVIAGTMGVMALEDFLFFVFSTALGTPYPNALARLFRGEATWHTGQMRFGRFKFPAIYFWVPLLVLAFLRIAMLFSAH